MCGEFEIRELPLMLKSVHDKVEAFLKANGLRMEKVDEYAAVYALGEDARIAFLIKTLPPMTKDCGRQMLDCYSCRKPVFI